MTRLSALLMNFWQKSPTRIANYLADLTAVDGYQNDNCSWSLSETARSDEQRQFEAVCKRELFGDLD